MVPEGRISSLLSSEICTFISFSFILIIFNQSSLKQKKKYEFEYHTELIPYLQFLLIGLHFQWVWLIGRVFANGPGDLISIPGHVILKTLKMVLDTSFLSTQQYKVCIKDKEEQSKDRRSALPTLRCSSYWKESLLVALDYGRQLYLLTIVFTNGPGDRVLIPGRVIPKPKKNGTR